MGTRYGVVGSNSVVAYGKIKMFALLPQFHSQDFVDCFIRNFFQVFNDVFQKWLENFDIELFNMIDNLKPDLKFIVENLSEFFNFLDINNRKVKAIKFLMLTHSII